MSKARVAVEIFAEERQVIHWVWVARVLHHVLRGAQRSESGACILDEHVGRVHHRLCAPDEMEIEETIPSCRQAHGPGHEPLLQLILVIVVGLGRGCLHVIPQASKNTEVATISLLNNLTTSAPLLRLRTIFARVSASLVGVTAPPARQRMYFNAPRQRHRTHTTAMADGSGRSR